MRQTKPKGESRARSPRNKKEAGDRPAADIIGEALAAILNNEETPQELLNGIVDALAPLEDAYSNATQFSPNYLSKVVAFNIAAQAEESEKGGGEDES